MFVLFARSLHDYHLNPSYPYVPFQSVIFRCDVLFRIQPTSIRNRVSKNSGGRGALQLKIMTFV